MKNQFGKKRIVNIKPLACLVVCSTLSGCFPSVSYNAPAFEEFENVFVINSESKNCPFVLSFQGSKKGYDIFNPVQELGIKRDGFWIGFDSVKGQKMSVFAVSSCESKLEINQYKSGKLVAKKSGQGLASIYDNSLLGPDIYEIEYSGTASFNSEYTVSDNTESQRVQIYRNQTPPISVRIEKDQGFSLFVTAFLNIQGSLKVEILRNGLPCNKSLASGINLSIFVRCPSMKVVN